MIPDRAQKLNPAGAAAIPPPATVVPPPPPVPNGQPDEYGEIVMRWNGPVVVEAPPRSRISLELVQAADPRALAVNGSTLALGRDTTGRFVVYRVTGWDDDHHCLLVERTSP